MSLPIHDAAVRAWCARVVADLFEPLWAMVRGNPLAVGAFCECGTRLNIGDNYKPDEIRPCPLCSGGGGS